MVSTFVNQVPGIHFVVLPVETVQTTSVPGTVTASSAHKLTFFIKERILNFLGLRDK
jgi:hypothetical protein